MTPTATSSANHTPTLKKETLASRPNVLIIGAARAGSTFLVNQLTHHPDIATSNPKETHFLSLGRRSEGFSGPGDEATINRQIQHSLAGWESTFLPAQRAKIRVDASVSMLYYAEETISQIDRYLGDDLRVIVVLRDPVDRAFSAFKYLQNRGYETSTDFAEALDVEYGRMSEGWHHLWHYSSMSRYAEQLEPWINRFGSPSSETTESRLMVVDYDRLTTDSATVCAELIDWMGLDPVSTISGGTGGTGDTDNNLNTNKKMADTRAVNSSGELRSSGMQQLLTTCRKVGWLQRAVKAAIPFELRERIRSLNLRTATVSDSDRSRLMGELEQDMARLRDMLGPLSPAWLE